MILQKKTVLKDVDNNVYIEEDDLVIIILNTDELIKGRLDYINDESLCLDISTNFRSNAEYIDFIDIKTINKV